MLGTVWEYMNASALVYAGFQPTDYEQVAVDSNQDGLALCNKGDADAFFCSGENASRLQEYGWTPLFGQEEAGIETYSLYMASQDYLSNHKDTAVKFIQASQEIMDFIKNNVDDAADILYNAAGMKQDVFKNSVADIELDVRVDQMAYDALQKVADWTQENGYYDNAFSIGDYLDTDALAEAFPDKVSYTAK